MSEQHSPTQTPAPEAPAAQAAREHRRQLVGTVISDRGDKTITVRVDRMVQVPKYGKYIRRSTKVRVHDESNQAHVGDVVAITECRPISKTKSWRLQRVMRSLDQGAGAS